MPKKSSINEPVTAFVAASKAYAEARSRLQHAVDEDTLNHEQRSFYELLQDGVAFQKGKNGAAKQGRKEAVGESNAANREPVQSSAAGG